MSDQSGSADSSTGGGPEPTSPEPTSPEPTSPEPTSPQQTSPEPTGADQAGYDHPEHGQPGYAPPGYAPPGYAPPGYAPPGYGQPAAAVPAYQQNPYQAGYQGAYAGHVPPPSQPVSASTVVLLVLSALLTLSCYFSLAGVPPLILSIIALTRQNQDPAGARKLTRIGWIVFASLVVLTILAIGGAITAAILSES